MKKVNVLLIALISFYFISCNQSGVKQNNEKSSVYEVVNPDGGTEMEACFHSSKIYWKGTKPTGEHNGLIKLKNGGKFLVDNDKLVGGEFIIDMSSIANIDLEDEEMKAKLVNHLKSADFFDVDSFPEAKFVIGGIKSIADNEVYNTEIKGDLTIKGITETIIFKAKVTVNDGRVTAMSEDIVIDRTKFGVNYQSKSVFKELKDKFIDDEFTIKLEMYSM